MFATPDLSINPSALLSRAQDIKLSFLLWGAYMVVLTSYCLAYQYFVSSEKPDVLGCFAWILREWGMWMAITPVLFVALRRLRLNAVSIKRQLVSYLRLAALGMGIALLARYGIDRITEMRGVAPILVIYFPRYLAAMLAILVVWHFAIRPRQQSRPASREENRQIKTEQPDVLLVSKGNDECLLPVSRIQCVCAAGNYVEIYSEGQVYLMRATMKQLEERLPASTFMRIHRSHIVRVDQIERIKTRPSGNGHVHLHSGKVLKISKHYRAQLQQAAATH